ncbi:hypothetical protein D3C87_1944350 [compost metagenome]
MRGQPGFFDPGERHERNSDRLVTQKSGAHRGAGLAILRLPSVTHAARPSKQQLQFYRN